MLQTMRHPRKIGIAIASQNWQAWSWFEPIADRLLLIAPQEKFMNRVQKALSLAAALVTFAFGAMAQNIATANLRGVVKDQHDAVIQNAKVTARLAAQNLKRTTQSNSNGEYVLLNLPPGTYSIQVEAPGFAKLLQNQVVLNIGQDAELPVIMRVAAATEEVTVESGAELVETQRSSESTTIDRQRIENLPINGRNYINFALTN